MSVKVYTFTYAIEGKLYGGTLPARSWDEAQALVPFALIDGQLIAEYHLPDREPIFVPNMMRIH